MKTKNSLMYSVTYENYQKNILNDKENRTQGSWNISSEMTHELKYAYVYLKNSEKTKHPNRFKPSLFVVRLF